LDLKEHPEEDKAHQVTDTDCRYYVLETRARQYTLSKNSSARDVSPVNDP